MRSQKSFGVRDNPLLDLMEIEEAKENLQNCKHVHEERSLTIWKGREHLGERMTMTCRVCDRIRGRYPKE